MLQIIFGLTSIFIGKILLLIITFSTINILGTFNFSLCYVEPKIPIYLILSGVILIINGSIRLCLQIPSSFSFKTVVYNEQRYKQPQQSTFAAGTFCRYASEGSILFLIVIIVIFGQFS